MIPASRIRRGTIGASDDPHVRASHHSPPWKLRPAGKVEQFEEMAKGALMVPSSSPDPLERRIWRRAEELGRLGILHR